jgi:heavy metal translocating P-type ATPase
LQRLREGDFEPPVTGHMIFEVRHRIPGRVRLRISMLRYETSLATSLVSWMESQPGVERVRINHACASVAVEYDREQPETWARILFHIEYVSLEALREIVSRLPPGSDAKKQLVKPAATLPAAIRWPLLWPSVSLALAFSASVLVALVNVPLLLWNSMPIGKRAWRVWSRERRLNVDFLDVLAISASLIQGNMVTAAVITWLIRLGDWIRDLTAAGSKRAVSELLEYQTQAAWILTEDGAVVSIPASRLETGNIVVVHPGEMIPVDGEVIDGCAIVDQKTITGEGLPVTRAKGELVFAATVIREGQITVRAMRVGSTTAAAQIVQLVEAAPVGETRMQNHAEKFADRLVLPTLGLATGTAFVTGDVNRFLSLVIVDYGTGIRVAAPTAVLASMTHAARMGIIIKSGHHMERLAEVNTIVFDKTGTLTRGVPAVSDLLCYNDRHFPQRLLLGLAAAAESRLHHPVAEAIRARSRELEVEVPACSENQYRIGLGVEARVNGYYMHVGSERFLRQNGIAVEDGASDQFHLNERGYSSLYVAADGKLVGLIPYADQLRPESREVIQALHNRGIRQTVMLTGDNAVVAGAVCRQLGLTRQYADTLPAEKAEIIQDLRSKGNVVAMVGDGINDSPALCYADVGIAMKHGAEVTHESAHVVLMEDNLWRVVAAVDISRGAVSLIKQNYGIVAALNTIALVLALPGGLVSPTVTALISNGSAVIASLNGMRPILRYQ